jgi:hypothetical protein
MRRTLRGAGVIVAVLAAGAAIAVAASTFHGPVKVKPTSELNSVACPKTGPCIAVGETKQSSEKPANGAVVSISGNKAKVTKMSKVLALDSIACPAAKFCVAVGAGKSRGAIVPISNGKPGTPTSVKARLQAISCATRSSCWVTGMNLSYSKPVIVHTNGAKVLQVYTQKKEASKVSFSGGEGASSPPPLCTSAKRCLGVGSTGSQNRTGVVFSLINGKIAEIRKVPGTSALTGMACPKTSLCRVVGYKFSSSGAQRAAGTRKAAFVQKGEVVTLSHGVPGKPLAAKGSTYLGDVACQNTRRCFAFGVNKSKFVAIPITNGKPGHKVSVAGPVRASGCGKHSCLGVGSKGNFPKAVGVFYRFL